MTEKLNRHLIVVYHEDCIDGLTSAWTLHQKWGQEPGTNIAYIPYSHYKSDEAEKNILSMLTSVTELYFVDVAPEKSLLDDLLSPCPVGKQKLASVHILDHHKTAADNLKNYTPPATKDFKQPALNLQVHAHHPSAAKMIWQILFPDQPSPPFMEMIDKMDIGEGLKTPDDFSAAALIDSKSITSITTTFNSCNELARMTYHQMTEEGKKILDDQNIRINKLADNVMYTQIQILPSTKPVWVPIINADVQEFGRAITNYLQNLGKQSGSGTAFAWYMEGNGSVTMSIRTDGTVDASRIAGYFHKKMNISGGGHKTSAAVHFQTLNNFSDWIHMQPAENMPQASHSAIPRKSPPGSHSS